jgi:hypothetical protein
MLVLFLALACGDGEPPAPVEELSELRVGMATKRMPLPVGIGTVGYGGFGLGGEPSPFAELYPATTRVHNHPNFKALVVSRGDGHEVVWLRSDTVGIFQQMREAIVIELEERLGKNLDHSLIIGATHTHSGPGRVIDAGGPFDLIADRFFPEFYVGMVDAMADVVEEAYADLQPGRIGLTTIDVPDAMDDRRCEDGLDYVNAEAPMLVAEQNGELAGLLMTVPIHGTVLSISQLTLSSDVSGAIEYVVEDQFDQPVSVMMMNNWGADMSPGNPSVMTQDGAEQPNGYDRMEKIGVTVADEVVRALEQTEWMDSPTVWSRTGRVRIDRESIGYDEETFLYEYGGVYCGSGLEADCETVTDFYGEFDDVCVPFSEEFGAPKQTLFTVGQVGDLHYMTFPGEPGTLLIESITDSLRQAPDVDALMVIGYGQDYIGYSLLEDDWWQGGYEASGGLWGPRQGAYLADRVVDFFDHATSSWLPFFGPSPLAPFDATSFDPYLAIDALELGSVLEPVQPVLGVMDTVVFTVAGSDPWLGTPVATLESADSGTVLRPNGEPLTSDGLGFYVDLMPVPGYSEAPDATERRFQWQFSMPVRHQVIGALPELIEGESYRLRVEIPEKNGSLIEVYSEYFEYSASG